MGLHRRFQLAWAVARGRGVPGAGVQTAPWQPVRLHAALPLAVSSLLVAMPLARLPAVAFGGLPLGEVQALNRELGRLCVDPPRQALSVCRIHARLVRAL